MTHTFFEPIVGYELFINGYPSNMFLEAEPYSEFIRKLQNMRLTYPGVKIEPIAIRDGNKRRLPLYVGV